MTSILTKIILTITMVFFKVEHRIDLFLYQQMMPTKKRFSRLSVDFSSTSLLMKEKISLVIEHASASFSCAVPLKD